MANALSLWLMPAEPLKGRLRTAIHNLAMEFEAPEFDPHITLYHGAVERSEATALAAKLASTFKPIEIESQGLGCGKTYTETLYVKFHLAPSVKKFLEVIKAAIPAAASFSLNPHISLLYKDLPIEKRRELCLRQIVRSGIYLFDGIRIMEADIPITEQSANEWQIVAEHKLGEG